mmetsp:Transcript_49853/g.132365  ORF Transcript_49853/g.132365 Transcript_49853/m.132365 type:complete len:225 (+) Transcript_49853:942-1616(+)
MLARHIFAKICRRDGAEQRRPQVWCHARGATHALQKHVDDRPQSDLPDNVVHEEVHHSLLPTRVKIVPSEPRPASGLYHRHREPDTVLHSGNAGQHLAEYGRQTLPLGKDEGRNLEDNRRNNETHNELEDTKKHKGPEVHSLFQLKFGSEVCYDQSGHNHIDIQLCKSADELIGEHARVSQYTSRNAQQRKREGGLQRTLSNWKKSGYGGHDCELENVALLRKR